MNLNLLIVLVLYYRFSWYTPLVANWNKNSFLEIFSPVVFMYKTQTFNPARSKMLKNIWRAHLHKISTSHCIYSPSGPPRLHWIFYYHKSFSGIRLLLFFRFLLIFMHGTRHKHFFFVSIHCRRNMIRSTSVSLSDVNNNLFLFLPWTWTLISNIPLFVTAV